MLYQKIDMNLLFHDKPNFTIQNHTTYTKITYNECIDEVVYFINSLNLWIE